MKRLSTFKHFASATHQQFFAGGLTAVRVLLGVQFLNAGITKIGGWSAAGYLSGATGPFAGWFQSMAGSVVVDQLNIWGLTLIGLALILGLAVRPASFFGAIMMLLYYFAQFEENTSHGIIDSHIIYVAVFVLFMAGGVGHVVGLDSIVSRHFRKKKVLGKLLFG